MKTPASIDAYLAAQAEPVRARLSRLRAAVAKAVPAAEETISYGMPAFRLHGRVLLYFAGWKAHYALYPGSARVVADLAGELTAYEVSKGTIRFPAALAVPVRLVERIARLRAAEVAAKAAPARSPAARAKTAARRPARKAPASAKGR